MKWSQLFPNRVYRYCKGISSSSSPFMLNSDEWIWYTFVILCRISIRINLNCVVAGGEFAFFYKSQSKRQTIYTWSFLPRWSWSSIPSFLVSTLFFVDSFYHPALLIFSSRCYWLLRSCNYSSSCNSVRISLERQSMVCDIHASRTRETNSYIPIGLPDGSSALDARGIQQYKGWECCCE